MHKIFELKGMDVEQLQALASELGIKGFKKMEKEDLVYSILDEEARKNALNVPEKPVQKKRGRPKKEEVTVEKKEEVAEPAKKSDSKLQANPPAKAKKEKPQENAEAKPEKPQQKKKAHKAKPQQQEKQAEQQKKETPKKEPVVETAEAAPAAEPVDVNVPEQEQQNRNSKQKRERIQKHQEKKQDKAEAAPAEAVQTETVNEVTAESEPQKNDNQQQNSVEQIFQRMECHLGEHDTKIKCPEGGGDRDVEEFLQDQRRDIHTACGCAGPNHDTKAQAQTHTGEEHIQQDIFCDNDIT